MPSHTGSHSPHFPSEIEFGAFLVYPSPAKTSAENSAKSFLLALKRDAITNDGSVIQLAIDRLKLKASGSCLADLLDGSAILVPTPGSGLPLKNSVWCARTICQRMVAAGLGSKTIECVTRVQPIRKSAFCKPGERPTPLEHYKTMAVKALIDPPQKIILVDDVITKGATFAGAAARLAEAFPKADIRAFAMARTTSNMQSWVDPCLGQIGCSADGSSSSRIGQC